ncbi:asparagine synthase-related protein [Paenibacillus arenilitoris]|uniref:asparagine synthase (glutamine-hydrolyzing) n=1 Tax=Paenibacillus arenilitoris TaxID=2772299 RepID=A0A927CQ77_9BACL|nr:asparagine synthase-related protein [Paenibacillus arenilitoris]MBD2872159.1 asparagine synthetase B [Paenibacillus arenilitoris]
MSVMAGVIQFDRPLQPSDGTADFMEAVRHFPGNAFETWEDGTALFGCRSQWITPESVHERLPYRDGQSGLVITADAIIDNRGQLFEQLGIGRDRRNDLTDSELILLAYRKWGSETPNYLIGDFAFVIWDESRKLLYGARDQLGSRTLYYHRASNRFSFCSVIHPLFSLAGIDKRLGEERFAEFLAIPTLLDAVDVHTTYYADISQLPPAHSFTLQEGKLEVAKYGSLMPERRLTLGSDDEYVEAFKEIFQQSIRARLRTFKQVGVTLSGGLDSGSVSAFAAGMLAGEGKSLQAYSYIPERDFIDWTPRSMFADESPYIQSVVDYVGNMNANYLDFHGKSPFTEIDEWMDGLEAPYKNFENAFWVKGIHEEAARQGIGVLLTGARGNYSISWGSAVGYYSLLLKKLQWLQLYREISMYGRQLGTGRKRIVRAIKQQVFPEKGAPFQPGVPSIIEPDFARSSGVFEKLSPYDVGLRESTYRMLTEREDYFGNQAVLNMQGTISAKSSYRLGLWERDATSDVRLIKFCLSIPVEQYVKNGFGRSLIRRATENRLPDKVRLNQRTRGVQGMDWVHRTIPRWQSTLEELRTLCEDDRASRYLNVMQVKESLDKVGPALRPEQADDPHLKLLMRSLIAYRFLKRLQ